MRLTFRESIGLLHFRRYQHGRYGVVETLTQQSVVYVRPVFGLLKPDERQPPANTEFRTHDGKPKRSRKAKRSVGGPP